MALPGLLLDIKEGGERGGGGYGCKVSLLLKCVELPLRSLTGGWLKGNVLAIGFVLLPSPPAGWLWLVGVPVSWRHSKRLQPPITTPSPSISSLLMDIVKRLEAWCV